MELVSSCVSWGSYFCGLVPLWINVQSSYLLMSRIFFSRETNVFLEGRYFFRGSEIFCCGPNIFLLMVRDFSSWVQYFFCGPNIYSRVSKFFLVDENFFCLFLLRHFFQRSKFCIGGINRVISIDHEQIKVFGKLLANIKKIRSLSEEGTT